MERRASCFRHTSPPTTPCTFCSTRAYDKPPTLQRSVDGGRSWQTLGGGLPADLLWNAVTVLPGTSPLSSQGGGELYFGSVDGTNLVIRPDRLTWSNLAPLTAGVAELDIQDIAVAPDGTLFIAHSTAGVLRSTDGGRTWSAASFPARGGTVEAARLAEQTDGTVFASVDSAIERSRDSGQTWDHLAGVPVGFEVTSLAVSPNFAADGIVVAGGDYTSRKIIRSADRGQTWQVVFDASSIKDAAEMSSVAFSPRFARDGSLFAWLQDAGLVVSTDGGINWTLRPSGESNYYGQSLLVSPKGDKLYLGALYGHTLRSTDDGQTWADLRDNIPDERVWSSALVFDAAGMLYLGTDVGVYRSRDGGTNWQRASAGLPIDPQTGKPNGVRALASGSGLMYVALSRGGVFVSADQSVSWRNTLTGEPASPIPAAEPPPPPSPTPLIEPTPRGPAGPSDCANQPAFFTDLWSPRFSQLGCPTNSKTLNIVEQPFEGGWMFWRSDTRVIYVIPAKMPYATYQDTWTDTQPEYTCPNSYPRQTPPTPKRGFGKVWCDPANAVVRKLLGNATGDERAFMAAARIRQRNNLEN